METRILESKDIDYMLSIVKTSLNDKIKAEKLYGLCNFKSLNDTIAKDNAQRKDDLEKL